MSHINALKTLTQGFQKKHLADWILELNPHEELVLLHVLEHNLGNKKSNIHGHQIKIPMKKDKDLLAFHRHFKTHGKVKTAHQIHASGFGSAAGKFLGKAASKAGKVVKVIGKGIAKGAQKAGEYIAKYGKKAFELAKKHGVTFLKGAASITQVAVPILQATGVLDDDTAMILGALSGVINPESESEEEDEK